MYVIIDNYDSFTYNLFQYVSALTDEEVRVFRNDRVTVAELDAMQPTGIIVSPGPGRPEDAGVSVETVRHFAGRTPLLGVCLGHQAIGYAFGGAITGAGNIVHGKTDRISLDGRGLFRGVPSPSVFTRYHSLVVQRDTLPAEFEVTAESPDGEVMGIRHREWVVEGVQFHPESIASEAGMRILANFLDYRREPFAFRPLLDQVMGGGPLGQEQADELMDEIAGGRLASGQLAALLVALSMQGCAADYRRTCDALADGSSAAELEEVQSAADALLARLERATGPAGAEPESATAGPRAAAEQEPGGAGVSAAVIAPPPVHGSATEASAAAQARVPG